jgi:hypothetical protein
VPVFFPFVEAIDRHQAARSHGAYGNVMGINISRRRNGLADELANTGRGLPRPIEIRKAFDVANILVLCVGTKPADREPVSRQDHRGGCPSLPTAPGVMNADSVWAERNELRRTGSIVVSKRKPERAGAGTSQSASRSTSGTAASLYTRSAISMK